ncbi:MAG: restriction endonuclease [Cellulomonas sp.]|uniref:restriction endonuclease n=1 Tax=Cellulomonas sp. TaxID=40001 RepID=UPI001A058066|nr:restriction endonuclease [Cellulomonas sp.]MBF0688595.1 restriction endonuclease [Cellulomonas sp.]
MNSFRHVARQVDLSGVGAQETAPFVRERIALAAAGVIAIASVGRTYCVMPTSGNDHRTQVMVQAANAFVESLTEDERAAILDTRGETNHVAMEAYREFLSVASKEVYGSAFARPTPEVEELVSIAMAVVVASAAERQVLATETPQMSQAREAIANRTPPAPQPYGVSFAGAELLCAEWMTYLGLRDVQVTRYSQDGGIDITSQTHVAQVKHQTGSTGAPAVREIAGAAMVDGRLPLFFSSGPYTPAAIEFAEAANVPLFQFDADNGTLIGVSALAESLLRYGAESPAARPGDA